MSVEQHQAAIIIQKHVRGILTRSHLKEFVYNLRSRKYIANEILSSERGYVKMLDTIVNVFFKPLKQSKIVTDTIIRNIFCNVDELYSIHSSLIKEMEGAPFLLGSAFAKYVKSFAAYRPYIANYTTSLTTFNGCLEKKAFADCMKNCCSKKPGLQPTDLPALLNKPVVQLSRYKLLLEDLLSKTNPQNEDFNNLQHAVQLLRQVAGDGGDFTAIGSPGHSPRDVKSDASSDSGKSAKSMKSNTSSASLARKLNAIAQAPHNLPYKLSPFVSRSVSNTPRATPSPSVYDPGDPSLPSYLRPTHTSYARANEGRAKKDQVAYVNNNAPTWMPNGNPHQEKIYNTVYNAIPYTARGAGQTLDRSASAGTSKAWMPGNTTPRGFDGSLVRSASAMSSREREAPSPSLGDGIRTPHKSPSGKSLSNTLSSSLKLTPTKTPSSTPLKKQPSSTTTTPTKPTSTTTPTKSPSSSSLAKTPAKTSTTTLTAKTPAKPSSTATSKTPSKSTTPSKPITPASKAASLGSHLPVPKTTPGAKTGVASKSPSQNGFVSKIPVLKSGGAGTSTTKIPTPEAGGAQVEDASVYDADGLEEYAQEEGEESNGFEEIDEGQEGVVVEDEDDETMTF